MKRISELDHISTFDQQVSPSIFSTQEKTALEMKNVKAKTRTYSFYLCKNGLVIKVYGFNDTNITGRVFMRLKNFYKKPKESKTVNIYKSAGLSNYLHLWSVSDLRLRAKCWVMPIDNGCFILPLVNTDL